MPRFHQARRQRRAFVGEVAPLLHLPPRASRRSGGIEPPRHPDRDVIGISKTDNKNFARARPLDLVVGDTSCWGTGREGRDGWLSRPRRDRLRFDSELRVGKAAWRFAPRIPGLWIRVRRLFYAFIRDAACQGRGRPGGPSLPGGQAHPPFIGSGFVPSRAARSLSPAWCSKIR